MSLLEIRHLTQFFGERCLYRDAELTLEPGQHVGITGRNGAGKSTLLKICTGQVLPDEGQIKWQREISVGYLDQYAEIDRSLTIRDFLRTAFLPLYKKADQMEHLYEQAGQGDEKSLYLAAQCQEWLEKQNFYQLDTILEQVAEGLGLRPLGLDRRIGAMSGGQRAKVILAKLLLQKPDVLLLDEPTNFLDKAQVRWLADFLSASEKAFLTVSHDERFLEKIADHVCEIDHGKIREYTGNYSAFQQQKAAFQQEYDRQYRAQQRKIQQTEVFIQKNRAGKKAGMARGRQKQLDRMERLQAPTEERKKAEFSFPALPMGPISLTADRLSVGYEKPLLENLNFCIRGGEKVVLTGQNGAGKSTLLRTLLGQLPALSGGFRFSGRAVLGYFPQDLSWENPELTPLELVKKEAPSLTGQQARGCLARCGVAAECAARPVHTLSGGEQAKIKLCLLTLRPCNFLILDEPTNHLDRQAKEALRQALEAFPGTVLLVCHEEDFLRGWKGPVLSAGAKEVSL